MKRLVAALAVAIVAFLLWPASRPTWTIRNAHPREGPIVCFGDSLTYGQGAERDESYPAVLGRLLGRTMLNRGRNGDTSESALERLEGDVLAASPSVVILTLGGNDMLRRVPVADTVRAMRTIFERILSSGAMVVFLAIDPPFVGDERMRAIEAIARELGVLYVDSAMTGMWTDRALMSDRIHPNAAGYRLIAERVRDALAGRL